MKSSVEYSSFSDRKIRSLFCRRTIAIVLILCLIEVRARQEVSGPESNQGR